MQRFSEAKIRAIACLAIGLSLLLAACEHGGYSDAAHALNDLGVAQMGRFEYAAAHGTFTGLVDANPGWHEAISLDSLMVTAEVVARHALIREESRGAHTRLDFEGEREEWEKINIISRKGPDGKMEVRKEERPAPPPRLAEIAYAKIEDLESGKVGADA